MTQRKPATPFLVTVIGDSLPLPRQFQGLDLHNTYPYLLAHWLREHGCEADVWEIVQAGAPIASVLSSYDGYRTYLGQHRQGIGIAHLGVVDCSPRPVPLFVRNLISRLPGILRSPIVAFLHKYRVPLLRYGPGFVFTGLKQFRNGYQKLMTLMRKDFGHVYAINIIPPGPFFESRSPGVGRLIESYNRIIAEVVRSNEGVTLIDIWEVCQQSGAMETYVSSHDGHHLSVAGHRQILDMIGNSWNDLEFLSDVKAATQTEAGVIGEP
jgi:hypothetical protein